MLNRSMILLVYTLILSSSVIIKAQFKEKCISQETIPTLTGNLQIDFISNINLNNLFMEQDSIDNIQHNNDLYSPLKAGLYSAILPGAGQFYTRSYWQSAAFLSVEVMSWILYVMNENKGDRQTEDFQKYADEHWSVVDYVKWIERYYSSEASGFIFYKPNTNTLPPWEQIDWEQLNACEQRIGELKDSQGNMIKTGFSHHLPLRPEQQYYELIGKYPQYGGGWDDAAWFTKDDVLTSNVSQKFLKYSRMRGDANNFYNIAATVSYVIVANHILNALEAAWNASKINQTLHLQGHIKTRVIYGQMVEFVPTLDLEIVL